MSIPKGSKQDWDIETGWEKRIAVDFGSIGPSHARWSHWTYKERDIVARKVHEIELISQAHGNRSMPADDWRKENAPIMIDFARDGKPMPDWAHADYRESGIPEHVEVIWQRDNPDDPASKGDWAYDPPHPWAKGEEPPWSAKIKDPEYTGYMDSKYGGMMSYTERKNGDRYDTSGNLISTKESRAKEDVPHWRKFELGRLEDVDGYVVPGPNALPKDIERYGENVAKTGRANTAQPQAKIMPGDPKHTDIDKALNWAAETRHGKDHQNRWNRVAATMGHPNGYDPYTFDEVKAIWQRFGKNPRWTVAAAWFDSGDKDVEGMVEYHFAPPMQAHYTAADFEKLWNQKPLIVQVKGWGKAIVDPKVGIPTYWLDGEGEATETWERVGDDWQKMDTSEIVGAVDKAVGEHVTGVFTWHGDLTNADGTAIKKTNTDKDSNNLDESNDVSFDVVDELPEMDEKQANEFYKRHKGDTITWVHQREPSIGPHDVSVLFHNNVPVAKKASRFDEFKHLPSWTAAQAEDFFINVEKVGSYSRRSLDGHWATVRGYCDPHTYDPVALAATEEHERLENAMNEAMRAGDWDRVAGCAKLMAEL